MAWRILLPLICRQKRKFDAQIMLIIVPKVSDGEGREVLPRPTTASSPTAATAKSAPASPAESSGAAGLGRAGGVGMAEAGMDGMDGHRFGNGDVKILQCFLHLVPHPESSAIDQPLLPHIQVTG